MFGSDPLEELVIPDGTHVKEHDLDTEGDVLVGGQSTVELGVRGNDVVAGERVEFGGDIEAERAPPARRCSARRRARPPRCRGRVP